VTRITIHLSKHDHLVAKSHFKFFFDQAKSLVEEVFRTSGATV
jgi:hypothetical protein